jgi:hypothetical protein
MEKPEPTSQPNSPALTRCWAKASRRFIEIFFVANNSEVKFTTEDLPSLEDQDHPSNPKLSFFIVKARLFWSSAQRLFTTMVGMSEAPDSRQEKAAARKYSWPRFVIAALVLAVVLAALWLSFEIRRTQRIRQLNSPTASP